MALPQEQSGLLPCPFCGGTHVAAQYVRDGWQMFCQSCGASVAPSYHGPNDDTFYRVIAAWNTRALTTSAPHGDGIVALIERLRKATMRFDWGDLPDDAAIPAVPLLRKAASTLEVLRRDNERLTAEKGGDHG